MKTINKNIFSSTLTSDCTLRTVEPGIYSVMPNDETGNEYDSQFGFLYDLIACSSVYNRLIWGYSVEIFSKIASEALDSSPDGPFLDVGCGSLAFTATAYSRCAERPILLVDQSLKILRMAKAKLIRQRGNIPENLVFLHADALYLPFRENSFTSILSENLLHCLNDTGILLRQLRGMLSEGGKMYCTTLVRAMRFADRYLEALAENGKLVSRDVYDHQQIFEQTGLTTECQATGNILVITGKKKDFSG